jgi:dipeptidyl aminopeptidase/acylaminoacyl peptidase
MRLHRLVIVSIGVLMLSGVVATQGRNTPEARLRAAMDKETVDGDLKAAIDGYKHVISQRGASREVVAQALLRLGMAYEKQGDGEARKSYERLVREFADQPAIVEQARGRIAAVTTAAAGPVLRRICSGNDCPSGGFTPGGRWLIFASQREGIIRLSDLVTGKVRRVAKIESDQRACCSAVSPDGSRVAYTLTPGFTDSVPNSNSQIFVANMDGSGVRMVYRGAGVKGWSADGQRLLVLDSNRVQLLWVTVNTGAMEPIGMSGWKSLARLTVTVSPDGRHIAFSGSRDGGPDNVYLIAADGSGETVVAASPNPQNPSGWSPDGKHLLYTQTGAPVSVWAVQVADGGVRGPAVKVKEFATEQVAVIGVTSSGTLHYRILLGKSDVGDVAEIWAMENFLPSGR